MDNHETERAMDNHETERAMDNHETEEPSSESGSVATEQPETESGTVDPDSIFDDPELVHKVMHACLESDAISEAEELRILKALLR